MKLIQVSEHPEDRERDGSLILPKEAEGDEIQHQATKANISIRLLKLSLIFQSNHLQGRFLSFDKSLGIINTQITITSSWEMYSRGGILPPKRMPRMALKSSGSTPISQVLRWNVPMWWKYRSYHALTMRWFRDMLGMLWKWQKPKPSRNARYSGRPPARYLWNSD